MSVSLQLVANGGDPEGLFRGAIMQSGAPLPVGDVTLGQKHYDDLVLRASCLHAEDTLDCLRRTPYETLKAAIDTSMGIFDYTVGALPAAKNENMADVGFPVGRSLWLFHGCHDQTAPSYKVHQWTWLKMAGWPEFLS
jgi:hypothetical protein